MLNASSWMRVITLAVGCAMAAFTGTSANAQTIDLSLNVFYNDPSDVNSGGAWQLVGKSSHSGITAMTVNLANINPGVANQAPHGIVNGSDPAGFSLDEFDFTTHRRLAIYQLIALPGPGEEEAAFYGVGTIPNGEPGDIGPMFTTLTDVQNVPWATGDPLGEPSWSSAALFASGSFPTNVTPSFFPGNNGTVFLAPGTSTEFGPISSATVSTTVRVATFSLLPDYNRDSIVDAADYVVWRKGLIAADGSNNGSVGPEDYELWREHFGESLGPGGGANAGGAIPEPAGAILAVFAAVFAMFARRPRTCGLI